MGLRISPVWPESRHLQPVATRSRKFHAGTRNGQDRCRCRLHHRICCPPGPRAIRVLLLSGTPQTTSTGWPDANVRVREKKSLGGMTYGFYVVPIWIKDKGPVVVRMVMGSKAWLAVASSPCCNCFGIKRVDFFPGIDPERYVDCWPVGLASTNPEVWFSVFAESCYVRMPRNACRDISHKVVPDWLQG